MRIFRIALLLLFCQLLAHAATLTYTPAPIDNPLKGICPNEYASASYFTNPPTSLMMAYVTMRSTVTAENTYDWSALETLIQKATNKSCQLIPRFVFDHPDVESCPQYLLDASIWTTNYDGVGSGLSLDYTNALVRASMTNFINAFGAQYDGDPRIAFIELGMFMPWGEWDTGLWPSLFNHLPPLETYEMMYSAYTNAFHSTVLMARHPAGDDNWTGDIPVLKNNHLPFGYHDDGFTTKTFTNYIANPLPEHERILYEWEMYHAGVEDKWKQYPFGGETYTAAGISVFLDPPVLVGEQSWSNCVRQMHATWIKNIGVYYSHLDDPAYTNRVWQGSRMLGYELWAKSYVATTNWSTLSVSVTVTNTGVAPFYYPWQVRVAAATDGFITKTWDVNWDIRTIIPGDGDVTYTATLTEAPDEDYIVLMKVVQPMTGGRELKFANVEQDTTVTNWLTLGTPTSGYSRAQNLRVNSIRGR